MWNYIGKSALRHIVVTVAAILVVCLIFFLLSGGDQWIFGEGASFVFVCG